MGYNADFISYIRINNQKWQVKLPMRIQTIYHKTYKQSRRAEDSEQNSKFKKGHKAPNINLSYYWLGNYIINIISH